MEENIFRKKNLDRLNSPEQLEDYLRVASPEIWSVLLGIFFLLAGVIAWGFFGRIGGAAANNCLMVVREQGSVCFVDEKSVSALKGDLPLSIHVYRMGEKEALTTIKGGTIEVVNAGDIEEDIVSLLESVGYTLAETMGTITLENVGLPAGIYVADVEQEGINPMSLLF